MTREQLLAAADAAERWEGSGYVYIQGTALDDTWRAGEFMALCPEEASKRG